MEVLLISASLWGSGQWNSYSTLPHCRGSRQWNSFCSLLHYLGAMGSGIPPVHCLTALGQWVVELLLYSTSLPWGSGQWNSYSTMPHCLRAMCSGTPAVHSHTALGHWVVELLQHTNSPRSGSGRGDPFYILAHCWGEVPHETAVTKMTIQVQIIPFNYEEGEGGRCSRGTGCHSSSANLL